MNFTCDSRTRLQVEAAGRTCAHENHAPLSKFSLEAGGGANSPRRELKKVLEIFSQNNPVQPFHAFDRRNQNMRKRSEAVATSVPMIVFSVYQNSGVKRLSVTV